MSCHRAPKHLSFPYIHLPICLSVHSFTHSSLLLSIYPFTHTLAVHLAPCSFIHPPSTRLSIVIHPSRHPPPYPSLRHHPSIYPSIQLPILHPSTYSPIHSLMHHRWDHSCMHVRSSFPEVRLELQPSHGSQHPSALSPGLSAHAHP